MLRKRRKKTKRLNSMSVICITAIVVLNGLGISYGAWNDGFEIISSFSTGNIEPYFISDYKLVGNDKGEVLGITINESKITIKGKVSSNYNDNLFIKIGNKGTAPIEYKELKMIEDNEIIKDLEVQQDKNEETKVQMNLNVKDEENENKIKNQDEVESRIEDEFEVKIEDEAQKESNYYFKYELIFVQKK